MAYARIEIIEPDVKRGWYRVTLLLLTLPLQAVTWILRESYVDGEPFTMGGTPMRLEEVRRATPEKDQPGADGSRKNGVQGTPGQVLPFKKR
jgi:hypothetical protein